MLFDESQINPVTISRIRRYHLARRVHNLFLDLSSNPTFLFGNEKSGTTAIARLLAEASAKSYTLDIPSLYKQSALESFFFRKMPLIDLIENEARWEFSKQIIKEPSLTLIFDQINIIYPTSKKVFIVRDPRDNIRSILNRINLKGDKEFITASELDNVNLEWRKILYGDWLELEYSNYIDSLAQRWNYMTNVYKENQSSFLLVRYEDFLLSKKSFIEELVERLDIELVNDISTLLDVQFQPKGDSSVSWLEFFGEKNLKKIENICAANMQMFNYPK